MAPILVVVELDPLGQLHDCDVVDKLGRAVKIDELKIPKKSQNELPQPFIEPKLRVWRDAHDGDQHLTGILAVARVVTHAYEDGPGLVVPWEISCEGWFLVCNPKFPKFTLNNPFNV